MLPPPTSPSTLPVSAADAAAELLALSDALLDVGDGLVEAPAPTPRLVCDGTTGELLALNATARGWPLIRNPADFFAQLATTCQVDWLAAGVPLALGTTSTPAGELRWSSRLLVASGHSFRLVQLTLAAPLAPLPACTDEEVHTADGSVHTVIDVAGRYVDVNEAAARLAQLPRSAMKGQLVTDVLRMVPVEQHALRRRLDQALRGRPGKLSWWYQPAGSGAVVHVEIELRGVRYRGQAAVFTRTRVLASTNSGAESLALRNSQLELTNFLLSHAARFERPTELLAFVLEQLVAKTTAVSGAVYAYDPARHHLRRQHQVGLPDPRLAGELTVEVAAARLRHLARRAPRQAARLLTAEMERHCPDRAVAVLPLFTDAARGDALVLLLPATAPEAERTWLTALLGMLGPGLSSFAARDHLRQELVASQRRYQALFDASPDGLLLTADGGHLLDVNLSAAALLGYESADLRELTLDALIATDVPGAPSLARWHRLWQDTRLTGRPGTFEGLLRRANGTTLDAEVRLQRLELPGGPCVQVQLRDLAERRVTDAVLLRAEVQRQSARELRNLLGVLQLAYVSFDPEAIILAVNDFFVEMTGYAREELLGRNYFEVFVPDPAERSRRFTYYTNQVLRDESLESFYQSVITTKTGERRVMRWNRLFERNEKREIISTISLGRDATADVLAEEDSRLSQARFQDLFDNAHDLIQHVAPDNHFLLVNRAWQQTLGYTADDMAALTLQDIVHPYYRAKLMYQLRALYRGEAVSQLETVFLTKNGRSVNLIGSVSCQWQDGEVIASRIILHDITERIKAERLQKVYYSIANLAISTRDLDMLYAAIHRELGRLLDTQNCFIALCDELRTRLTFVYVADQHSDPHVPGDRGRPFGRGLSEYVIAQGRPQFLLRADLERLLAAGDLELFGVLPEVLLAAPLAVGGRVIGCIAVQDYTRADTYAPADLEILYFISSQVALAIDRKRSELQLNRQNARLNAIFESGSHLMWSVDAQSRLTTYNHNFALAFFDGTDGRPAAEEANARPPGGGIGETFDLRLVPHQHTETWQREYNRAFAGQARHFEIGTRRADGTEAWAEIYLNPIRLPDGTLEEVSGIAHDITEKKLAQLELARQEGLFRGIFESFQDVYYRTDSRGYLTLLSPSVAVVFGYAAHEITGRHSGEFYADPAEYSMLVERVRETGSTRGMEATFIDKAGHHRAVLINARQVYDAAGEPAGLEGLVMDIGELKQTQRELLHAKQQAEAALHAKTQFLANMSHELRTPMNGIIGMIELLQHTVSTAEQADYVETLRRSSDALLTILNDILDLSKIQAGKLALHPSPTDLRETLDKLVALFGNRAAQRALRFGYRLGPAVPRYVVTDEMRLLQILSNLVSNAIKFTSEGSVEVRVTLAAEAEYDALGQLELLFDVADSGIGIAPEDAPRLFTDFTQLDTTSTKSFGGTGLGLSISRQLAELLGGDIGVRPNPTGGSIFWFTIRCAPAGEAAEADRRAARAHTRATRLTGTFPNQPPVLLVDDNPVNQKVAARLLERLGCQVSVAGSGFEALRLVTELTAPTATAARPPILILMDIQMPDIDGVETTKRLRANLLQLGRPCPPVVAMTAYSMQGDDARFISLGFDGYVAKPVKSHDLFVALRQHCPTEPVLEEAAPALPAPADQVAPETAGLPALAPDPAVLAGLLQVGDAAFVRQLFDDFVTESGPQLEAAAAALEAGWLTEVVELIHQVKGASAQLGLNALADLARAVEQGARTEEPVAALGADLAQLRTLFTTFSAGYAALLPPAQIP